jgi:hypothetical protein
MIYLTGWRTSNALENPSPWLLSVLMCTNIRNHNGLSQHRSRTSAQTIYLCLYPFTNVTTSRQLEHCCRHFLSLVMAPAIPNGHAFCNFPHSTYNAPTQVGHTCLHVLDTLSSLLSPSCIHRTTAYTHQPDIAHLTPHSLRAAFCSRSSVV